MEADESMCRSERWYSFVVGGGGGVLVIVIFVVINVVLVISDVIGVLFNFTVRVHQSDYS
jgi:hypothetical protein